MMSDFDSKSIKVVDKTIYACSICHTHKGKEEGCICGICGNFVCINHWNPNAMCCNSCAERVAPGKSVEFCGVCNCRMLILSGNICRECSKPTCSRHFIKKFYLCRTCAEKRKDVDESVLENEGFDWDICQSIKGFTNMRVYKDSRDGYVYNTVAIGELEWFAENYRYSSRNAMPPQGNKRYISKYGRLYTWDDALDVVPPGWRIPTEEDFKNLESYVIAHSKSDINDILRAKTVDWLLAGCESVGLDEFGFGILPAGSYSNGQFGTIGNCATFWATSSQYKTGKVSVSFNGKRSFHMWTIPNGFNTDTACSLRFVRDRDLLEEELSSLADELQ